MSPKTKQKSGMNRRATQNKSPKSSLLAKSGTINWNVNAQQVPRMINTTSLDNNPYVVRQTSTQGVVLTSSNTLPVFYAKFWSSADILQYSSYASVFDQYRIDMVEVWLVPYGAGTIPGYNNVGKIYSVVDYDDASNLITIASAQQYENCVTTRFTDGHYIKFRPHIAVAAYGGGFTKYLNRVSDWIDAGSQAVEHYGMKLACDTTSSNTDVKIDMTTRLTVSWRNVF
jgi:hypothetical protein